MFEKLKEWNRRRVNSRMHRTLQRVDRRVENIESHLNALVPAIAQLNPANTSLSMANLRMHYLHCPPQYEYILCNVPDGALVIDGGANLGVFSDLMLGLGAKVHAFEPNPVLFYHLQRHYNHSTSNTKLDIKLFDRAISCENKKLSFSMTKKGSFIQSSQGGSFEVDPGEDRLDFDVLSINFSDYLNDLKNKGIHPYLIKLDIEGAEFDVIDQLIDKKMCSSFNYMVCETHERLFNDGEEKITALKKRLKEQNINNIFLDWY